MWRSLRVGVLVAVSVVLGAMGSCGKDPSTGSCEPGLTEDAKQLLVDGSGETLAKAVLEHVPTDDEMKLAAAYWALLAVGYQDGALAPAFFEARLDQQVAALMARYPSFVTCPEGGGGSGGSDPFHVGPLAASAGSSCSCSASCIPSASEVGGVLLDLGGLGLEIFSQSKAAVAVVEKLRFYADDVVNKVNAVKDLKEALGQGFSTYDATKAITEGVSTADALEVLKGVGEFVVVAGTIAGAATAAGAAAPSLATIAAVGAVVSAGMVGIEIGGKLNGMMNAYQACADCQAASCHPGTGGSDGGTDECPLPCPADKVCIDGACVDKTSKTTCELREPSCCPGHDDSCTAPDSACFCDAYCVEAGDCCPDACNVCGYCG